METKQEMSFFLRSAICKKLTIWLNLVLRNRTLGKSFYLRIFTRQTRDRLNMLPAFCYINLRTVQKIPYSSLIGNTSIRLEKMSTFLVQALTRRYLSSSKETFGLFFLGLVLLLKQSTTTHQISR